MNTTEGSAPLLELFNNDDISEIVINNENDIFYELKGNFKQHLGKFNSKQEYKVFAHHLCQKAKIQYDANSPCGDGFLAPFRIHIIAPPISKNVQITLRRHKLIPWSFEQLLTNRWADKQQINILLELVTAKNNILVIGPTGTGKTSCINALLQNIPKNERAIIIEDTNELKIPNSISTKLLTRSDIHGHLKSYNQEDLIKQALRMRPHRLIIGEVRGRESKDLLLALSTGHSGSICSLHAEDAHQALIRLEMLIKMGAPEWDTQVIRRLIFLSIQNIITLGFQKDNRILKSIHKVAGLETNGLTISKLSP